MCLLTVDALWNFFSKDAFDKGDKSLQKCFEKYHNVLRILKENDLGDLTIDQERVLKTILIMQTSSGVDPQGGGGVIEFFSPTKENIKDAFEGTKLNKDGSGNLLDGILEQLSDKHVISKRGTSDKAVYGVYGDSIDLPKIDEIKDRVKRDFKISNLGIDINDYMKLTGYLSLRYEIEIVSIDNIDRKINNTVGAETSDGNRQIKVFIALGKDDNEGGAITQKIRTLVSEKNPYCVVVDATRVPFGNKRLDEYSDHKAYEAYYKDKDSATCILESNKAYSVVKDWVLDLSNGDFEVYCAFGGVDCRKVRGIENLFYVLGDIDRVRYPDGLEGVGGFSDTLWTANYLENSVEQAVAGTTKKSLREMKML